MRAGSTPAWDTKSIQNLIIMAKLVLHHKDGREIKFNNADFKVVDSIVVVSENIPDEMFG